MMRIHLLLILIAWALIPACGGGPGNARRVLVVTIDTLRWDRLGYAGADVSTPNLDALAESGTYFTQMATVAPLTLPAHTSLFTGLYPPSHGVRSNGIFHLEDDVTTMAEVFRDAGYATGAFVGAFVLESRFGLAQGFDVYDDDLPDENPVHKIYFPERPASEVVGRALEWIRARGDEPFFCWVHVFDPHAPYAPPPPFDQSYAERLYEGEIAYTDQTLGPLLELVGSMDDSLVVVTADHGESLGEHGETTHGLFIYEATTRVPLVMTGVGIPRGKRVDARVRLVDVAPTILELAGLGLSAKIDGESLRPFFQDEAPPSRDAYAESFLPRYSFNWSELRSITQGTFKYIQAPRPELYDMSADPVEKKNLWESGPPEEGKRLAREMSRRLEGEAPSRQPVAIDPETAKRLESLGYLMAEAYPGRVEERDRPDPKDRIEVYERMQALLSPGLEVDEVLREYRDLLREEPTNGLARNRLANTLSEEGRLEEAIEEYRILIRDSEIDFKGWENLSAALLLLKRTDEAIDATEMAVAAARWNPDFWVLRGEALEQAGRLEEARDAYTSAIELEGSAENLWRRGVVNERLGADPDAEADFRRALNDDAGSESAVAALARLLAKTGRVSEAYEILESGSAGVDEDSADMRTALAEAHLAARRFDEAKAILELAERDDPDHTRVLALLGAAYAREGNLARAAEILERARALGESAPEVRRNLGLIYLQQGNLAAAVSELEGAVQDTPDEPSLWYSLGNAYARSRDPGNAVNAYERALALRSSWPEAHFNLAIAAEQIGLNEKAAEAYRAYLASADPSDTRRRAEAETRLRRLTGSD